MNLVQKEKEDILNILKRIKNRDFSGNTGLVLKNSFYQFLTNAVSNAGSLIFTVILARLLLPDLFGLYNLALSTILLFTSISDFGIADTLIKFISSELGKANLKKAKSYLLYLGKLKFIFLFLSSSILLISARYISEIYYNKPIYLALIAGSLYLVFFGILTLLQSLLQASNNFKAVFLGETSFQIARNVLVPIGILISLKYYFTNEFTLFAIIAGLSLSYLLVSIFIFLLNLKKMPFLKSENLGITRSERKNVNKFLLIVSITSLSGLFFSYVDRILLGHFVSAEFIGYYTAAFSLISAMTTVTGFGPVLFPVFSRMDEKGVKSGLKKSLRNIIFFSVIISVVAVIIAPFLVYLIYGSEYMLSTSILRLLSPLIIILPLTGVYSSYFMSEGKPHIIANLLIITTLINIGLNYLFITLFLKYGQITAVYGSILGTITSQIIYILGLFLFSRRKRSVP